MRNADGKPVTDITSVVKDANCSLWIASYGSGLLRYDLREERTYTYDDEVLRHAMRAGMSGWAPGARA